MKMIDQKRSLVNSLIFLHKDLSPSFLVKLEISWIIYQLLFPNVYQFFLLKSFISPLFSHSLNHFNLLFSHGVSINEKGYFWESITESLVHITSQPFDNLIGSLFNSKLFYRVDRRCFLQSIPILSFSFKINHMGDLRNFIYL